MEPIQISVHLCKIYLAVLASPDWVTAKYIAQKADTSGRSARMHLSTLADAGLLVQAAVFPGYRYRVSDKLDKTSRAMLERIDEAGKVFGLV